MAEEPLNIAVQDGAQPTNKVSAASNTAGGIAAVVASVMATYGADAIREALGEWGAAHPSNTTRITILLVSLAAFFSTKLGGQAAAYNILDKPNVPLVKARTAPAMLPVKE